MKHTKIVFLGIISLCLFSSALSAGVYMKGIMKSDGETEQMEMFIEKDRLRFESVTAEGKQIVIYRDDLKKFWMVQNGKYMEMTEADMKQMGEQMSEAMKAMEEQMQALPPEQRKMMEQMMKDRMPDQTHQEKKTEWKKIGNEKVNQWQCAKFQSSEGETAWTVQPEDLGLTEKDFQIFEKAEAFFTEALKDNDSFLKYVATDEDEGLSGFPVKTITPDGDEQLLTEITKKDLDSNLFELQKDWKKEDRSMMQMK